MRRALIGILLAATAVTPIAANAQDRGGRGRIERSAGRGEARAAPDAAAPQRQQFRERGGGQDGGGRRYQERAAQAQAQAVQAQAQQAQAAQAPAAVVRTPSGSRRDRAAAAAEPYRQQRDAALAAGDQRTAAAADHYGRLAAQNEARYGRGSNDRDRRNGRDWRNNNNGNRDWRNNNNGRNDGRDWQNNGRNDGRDWRNNGRNGRTDWNRGWRQDNRYDWQRYRYSNRNIFRPGPYYSPYRGYNYSRFSIGLFLNSGFYTNRYWISDPWQYRLPPAPAGTRWVRYYNDVLLVDMYNGEVVDAIYDFFW